MTKRRAQNREDPRVAVPRQEHSSCSRQGERDACATITLGRSDMLILLGLAVVTFGIYAQLIGHRFITIDDLSYIEGNPIVNRGVTLGGLAWAFTTFHSGNWHPLTWISHM